MSNIRVCGLRGARAPGCGLFRFRIWAEGLGSDAELGFKIYWHNIILQLHLATNRKVVVLLAIRRIVEITVDFPFLTHPAQDSETRGSKLSPMKRDPSPSPNPTRPLVA